MKTFVDAHRSIELRADVQALVRVLSQLKKVGTEAAIDEGLGPDSVRLIDGITMRP